MKLEHIEPGFQFEPFAFSIDESAAHAYIEATGGEQDNPFGTGVHPLQIDAVVLSRLIDQLEIIEDRIETIHAGQQMTLHGPIERGEEIFARTTLKTNALRRGSRWANFVTRFATADNETVAESTSTIILMPDA